MSRSTAATPRPQTNNAVRGWLQRNARSFQPPASSGRRRPALPSGYEPPDYLVVPLRLADGRVLHVNAEDLADPRYVNVRNLNPDGTPVKGRAGLQARAVFEGAEVLAQPWYGTEYRANEQADASDQAPAEQAIERLFQQAERAGIRLTPGTAEGVAMGDARVIAYVADLISQLGGRPAVEPRYQGGPLEPGKIYTVNEQGPEVVISRDGHARTPGDGRPAVIQAQQPGTVVPAQPAPIRAIKPDTVASMPWRAPHWDPAPLPPDSLGGPMPVMPKIDREMLELERANLPLSPSIVTPNPPPSVTSRKGVSKGVPLGLPHKSVHTPSRVQRERVNNALLALENTRFKDDVPHLQQMAREGRIRIDPELRDYKETKTAETSFGGNTIYLNPDLFDKIDAPPSGRTIAEIAGNLAHEYDHVKQWGNPVTRAARAFAEKWLPFPPFHRTNRYGETWGPLEWEPHEIGYEAEGAVVKDYKKNFIGGNRKLPLDPYFSRQGLSSPQELMQP